MKRIDGEFVRVEVSGRTNLYHAGFVFPATEENIAAANKVSEVWELKDRAEALLADILYRQLKR